MIDYFIACYFGPRRTSFKALDRDPFYHVKKHIARLNRFKDENINKVVFVVNPFSPDVDKQLEKITERLNIRSEIIYREKNIDMSYGCWHDAILANLDSVSEYFMLVEDDYAPGVDNYTRYFLEKFDENTAAVFQEYSANAGFKAHAAIANGVVSRSACASAFRKYGVVFNLGGQPDLQNQQAYIAAERNQVFFTSTFEELGYKIKDIRDVSKNKFQYLVPKVMVSPRGNPDGANVLEPLYPSVEIREMNLSDVPFYNETRNLSRDMLHDNSSYTLQESQEWFQETNPSFFIILEKGERIGYFRTSNYSEKNKNIYIGADIHPNFRGEGHAFDAYVLFIQRLFDGNPLHKISLEVLSNNEPAYRLYCKLGFVHEGAKRQEVYRENGYLDSIVMSLLREEWDRD